jgi:SAM-dependent methyltransferase
MPAGKGARDPMSDASLLKRQRESFLDRHPDAGDWRNRYYSAATLALWRAASDVMARECRGRTLDAGSGRGAWRRAILAYADACDSVDLEPRGDDRPTWTGDLMHMPQVPSAHYDTVVCHQVLEHLPDPGLALSELRRVLAPGGRLIISAPHLSRLHELPHDYFRYTPNGLRALLDRAGFTDAEVGTYGGPFSFLHHQSSFVFPGLLAGVPVVGAGASACNAAFSMAFSAIDRIRVLGRLLPLGVIAVARARA